MKQRINTLLHDRVLLGIVAFVLAIPAISRASITIELSSNSQIVSSQSEVVVSASISGLGGGVPPSLGTYDLDVTYDPSVLSYSSTTFGDPVLGDQLDPDGLGTIQNATDYSGVLDIFELSLDPSADLNSMQSSSFILAQMTFIASNPGTSTIGLSVNAVGDADGNSLDVTIVDPSIVVEPVNVPEANSIRLSLIGLLAIFAVSKTIRFKGTLLK